MPVISRFQTICKQELVPGQRFNIVVFLAPYFYYGNLKALCDHWGKDALGVGYAYLRNYGISEEKPFQNAKCVIRRGILVTSKKKVSVLMQ